MGDEARPLHAQQRRTTIFGVVQALLEIGECTARKKISDLACNCRGQRFLKRRTHEVYDTLGTLERNVSHKSIGNDHVNFPSVDIAAFDVSNEVQGELLEKLIGFASEFVPLTFFFANGKYAHARMRRTEHAAEINVSH